MANCFISFQAHTSPKFLAINNYIPDFVHKRSNLCYASKFRFPYSVSLPITHLRKCSHCSDSSSVKCSFSPEALQNGERKLTSGSYFEILKAWMDFVKSVMPGGNYWNIYDAEEIENSSRTSDKPISVPYALARIWELVADQKWVLYTAFGALIIAALTEISIPSVLAASIFSAQSGHWEVFQRNSKLLVFMCFTSGICSGLRSGCFAVANVILVKRLRETLYGVLLVQGTGAFIFLITLSWPLALSTMVICSLLSAIFLVYGRYQKKAAKLSQEYTASANKVATETLSLIRTVRAYGTEREEVGRFTQQLEKLAFVGMRESVAYGFWNLSFNTLYRSTQVVAVLFGGMFILMGLVSAEQLTKYVFYCEWLIYAAWRLQDNLSSLLQSVGACEKVFQLMNLLPSDQSLSKGVKLPTLMGYIDFVNVSFHYPSRNMVPVLDNVNFSIHANETIAIVGVSGSGKSTLINLMLRLYEQTDGQIFIDHFPLRELDIKWLRENIGFVGQDPHLFNMDVKSNISYGCFRDIRLEDIEWAAKQAYAHNFISSLPNGYETIVNDNLLSRGQKQRIALARAILRDPAILVLDEPTSALDTESEYYIKRFLRYFKNDFKTKRTVIVVAHRMSTVEAADRILVMDCGKIVEVGNHNDLLCKDGFYARLWRMQADPLVY